MKKLLMTSSFLAISFSAVAADLANIQRPTSESPMPLWSGFYAGLNSGYSFGTNSNISNVNYGAQKSFLNVLGTPWATASAFSGSNGNNQSGFLGGFQFGYNHQFGQSFVLGLEADIQGANIYGSGNGKGMGRFSDSDTIAPITGSESGSIVGVQSINAGVDYLGTVRARAGFLLNPAMLVYGTAGFSYGGAFASVNSYGVESLTASFSSPAATGSMTGSNTYVGSNRQSQLLTGWNAGGGAEWMFMPNWSLKGEAIYWNLGNMNVSTNAMGLSPLSSATANDGVGNSVTAPVTSHAVAPGITRINYQGVIVRAGLNHHFSWLGAKNSQSSINNSNIDVQSWAGAYAGLNAGYAFGTNDQVSSLNYGAQKTFIDIPGSPTAVANALSVNSPNTQNGFSGGMQMGYNHLLDQKYIVGIETDIQGTNIYGTSSARRGSVYGESDSIGSNTASANGAVLGNQIVNAGVDYLGTLRGRLGYLFSPALLAYGTAGFTYGGAFANINNYAIDTLEAAASSTSGGITSTANASLISTYYGANKQSQILTGWNAGGGFEWMFQPNWSFKGEAIYWNLGNMNVATNSVAVSPANSLSIGSANIPLLSNSVAPGITKINYQGVIARAGINYHFTLASPPVVAKY